MPLSSDCAESLVESISRNYPSGCTLVSLIATYKRGQV